MSHCDCDSPAPSGKQSATLRSVDVMISELLAQVSPIQNTENIPLTEALGRVLAESIVSTIDVPPEDNSAMDGYAVSINHLSGNGTCKLPISQRIPAGTVPQPLEAGTAARIFTGATIPPDADAVVMQEQCQVEGEFVILPTSLKPQQNIRPKGQDITAGQTVLNAGRRLQPQDLGLLASINVSHVTTYRRLKVAILSTGDELVEPGTPLMPGQIYNSNRYMLKGLLTTLGVDIIDLGRVKDTLEATLHALSSAAEQADVIITSGGVSVGEEDHVKAAIEQLGILNLWKLAIKPGKPFALGRIDQTPILGLPGNPGAVFVTFCILARPYLLAQQGAIVKPLQGIPLPLGFSINKAGIRREYLRVQSVVDASGKLILQAHPNQSSGVLSSASWADGFAIIMENTAPQSGDKVEFVPFSAIF